MADPTLKKTNIAFGYTASDGYRMSFGAKAGTGSKHAVTGEEVPPYHALLAGLEELTRILTLFGFESEAQEKFKAAQQAVFDWRADRAYLARNAGVPREAQKLIEQRRQLGWSDEQIVTELRYRGLPTDGVDSVDGGRDA
jgi:hypothetical protein